MAWGRMMWPVLCIILLWNVVAYKVVKNEAGEYFLIYPKRGMAARVPDMDTLKQLEVDVQQIAVLSPTQLAKYSMHNNSVPSLQMNVRTRDDVMRYEILKILALSPPTFWKETFYLGQMLNPTFELWHNKVLFAWRNGMYDSPMNFAWFSLSKLLASKDTVQLGKVDSRYPFFEKVIPLQVKEFDFNHLQEDPRLLARSDGNLTLVYTAKHSLFRPPKQCYCQLTMDKQSPTGLQVTDSVLLDGHTFDPGQKNWIPLEYRQQLYLLQSVNPLRVLRHAGANGSDPHIGRLQTVYESPQPVKLPWKAQYGEMIRGGTPAILVTPGHPGHSKFQKYYLAFFHSVGQLQAKNSLRTYFMGAMSFCPQPPFHLHAISTYPILEEKYYDGAWVEPRRTDYVMFAIGAFVLPQDPAHVYVSFGHQDKYGYLAKFHLAELFGSMEIVHDCVP